MKISFCDLKRKDVVNVCDGKNLGNAYDLILDTCCGQVLGIVVPISKSFFNIFKASTVTFLYRFSSFLIFFVIFLSNLTSCPTSAKIIL